MPKSLERYRTLAADAFRIAALSVNNRQIHIADKLDRNVHSPNLQGFTSSLTWINEFYRNWRAGSCSIIHDRQAEFGIALRRCHDELKIIPTSTFMIADKLHSSGLQMIDLILWLYRRDIGSRRFNPATQRLMARVRERSTTFDFTTEGVRGRLIAQITDANEKGLFAVDEVALPHDLAASEERRRAAMVEALAGLRQQDASGP